MVPPRREQTERVEIHHGSAYQEVDQNARLEVPDFHGHYNPKVFLDWLHSIEMFFKWYDIPKHPKLQFSEARLKNTARIWWDQYKDIVEMGMVP